MHSLRGRFVPVKSAEQQSKSMVFKTRDLFVRQRNAIINALRGHLMEYGIIAPAGRTFVKKLAEQIESQNCDLPPIVIELSRVHLEQLNILTDKVVAMERRLKEESKTDPETIRLQTAPGIGPVSAMAIKAFVPPLEGFKRGRDFCRVARVGSCPEVDWRAVNDPDQLSDQEWLCSCRTLGRSCP